MTTRFFVTIHERRRYFDTLTKAREFADRYMRRTGVILGIGEA